jgi:PD-(D/E)XK nuclease superfamily
MQRPSGAIPPNSGTVSFSRLSCYCECPAKYNNRYVNKLPLSQPLESYFLKGTLAHRCIEEYLNGAEKDDAIQVILPDWLLTNCLLPLETDEQPEGINPDELLTYALPVAKLLQRCSPGYVGTDAIRNNDGTAPKDPLAYPPAAFKQELALLGLGHLKNQLDGLAAEICLPFRRFSLCETTALALSYVLGFQIPSYVEETIGVEYDLSQTPVLYQAANERDPDTYWNGQIDWIFQTKKGEIVICDHKTEKKKPSGLDVTFHSQLNIYAYLYYEQTGKMPDFLGINHLPSNCLVLARVNLDVVYQNYKHWESVKARIASDRAKDNFVRRLPTEYNSPCAKRDWKSGELSSVCPYITNCWPKYSDGLGKELEPFLNEQTLRKANI